MTDKKIRIDEELNRIYEVNNRVGECLFDEALAAQDLRPIISLPKSLEASKAILKIIELENEFPGLVQSEMLDHLNILADSARKGKYPLNNWLLPDGRKTDKKTNYRSIQNHIDQENQGIRQDYESKRPPKLHAACRLMVDHTREVRGIVHPLDIKKDDSDNEC